MGTDGPTIDAEAERRGGGVGGVEETVREVETRKQET